MKALAVFVFLAITAYASALPPKVHYYGLFQKSEGSPLINIRVSDHVGAISETCGSEDLAGGDLACFFECVDYYYLDGYCDGHICKCRQ